MFFVGTIPPAYLKSTNIKNNPQQGTINHSYKRNCTPQTDTVSFTSLFKKTVYTLEVCTKTMIDSIGNHSLDIKPKLIEFASSKPNETIVKMLEVLKCRKYRGFTDCCTNSFTEPYAIIEEAVKQPGIDKHKALNDIVAIIREVRLQRDGNKLNILDNRDIKLANLAKKYLRQK